MDFDGNYEPLLAYCSPDGLKNIDILTFEDHMGLGATSKSNLGPTGVPSAFVNAVRSLDSWKYTDAKGTVVDYGSADNWGPDTILVLDNLTALSAATMARARAMANRTIGDTTIQVWGAAAEEQLNFIRRLTSRKYKHHTITLAHLKLIGPKPVEGKDDQTVREVKERIIDMVPTRYFPTAVGNQLPQNIAGEWPITINIENQVRGKTVRRRFNYEPRPDMDLKLPVRDLTALADLNIRDGMLRIFKALGAHPPKTAQ